MVGYGSVAEWRNAHWNNDIGLTSIGADPMNVGYGRAAPAVDTGSSTTALECVGHIASDGRSSTVTVLATFMSCTRAITRCARTQVIGGWALMLTICARWPSAVERDTFAAKLSVDRSSRQTPFAGFAPFVPMASLSMRSPRSSASQWRRSPISPMASSGGTSSSTMSGRG